MTRNFSPAFSEPDARVSKLSSVGTQRSLVGGTLCSLLLLGVLVGCRPGPVQFTGNAVHAELLKAETGVSLDEAIGDVEAVLVDVFGTPDEPRLPAILESDGEFAGLLSMQRLEQAAGPFASDRDDNHVGLYREHCNACHGLAGNGRGPAAMLQRPYPRDFRAGIFKYKSTPRNVKPTRDDLLSTLHRGLPGVPMPSFALLIEEEREALVDYVIYLSIRGEVERRLLAIAAEGLEYDLADGTQWLRPQERNAQAELAAEQQAWIDAEIRAVAEQWFVAESRRLQVEISPGLDLQSNALIAAGDKLYHGQVANCASCHGPAGNGITSLPADYDDWTKEWTTKLGIDPGNREKLAGFFDAGAFRPRALPARNLTNGVYRGGSSPEQLYLRIVHGIDGTPMPAVNLVDSPAETGLTADQVWQLVAYVRSLETGRSAPSTSPNANSSQVAEATQ
ncbi:cytochrome c [Planctomycetaceae bacterium SH139]